MTIFAPDGHLDLFVRENFLDNVKCREIISDMIASEEEPARVYGKGASGGVDELMRKTVRLTPSAETVLFVRDKLSDCKLEVEQHFSRILHEIEEPQFLRYRPGDFFVAHQDGNTGLVRMDSEARLVSVVILLSEGTESPVDLEHTYSGGALVFHDRHAHQRGEELPSTRKAGTLVAFRAETTHEVTRVTNGQRYSIASWYR